MCEYANHIYDEENIDIGWLKTDVMAVLYQLILRNIASYL